jgi:hypothetical protein
MLRAARAVLLISFRKPPSLQRDDAPCRAVSLGPELRPHRQERLWSRSCPRQNEHIADPAVAIPLFAMKQITRLDRAEGVHHADAIGEYNLGFHAVGMGNVAVEMRSVTVVPSRPVLGINQRQSLVGGTAGNRDLPLALQVVSLLRAKFARRAEKHHAEEKRSGQTPSHDNESITGVPRARAGGALRYPS